MYKEFNKDLENLNIIELYNHWINYGIKQKYIYSIKSFLYQNDYFNIEQYMKNNNMKNKINALIHYNQNYLLSDYFYSKIMFDVVFNNEFNNYKYENDNFDENDYEYYNNDFIIHINYK